MARAKKEAALTPEERLQAALVPDWEWPYKLPGNWCWTYLTKAAECLDNFRKPINATERAGRNGNVPYYGATGQVGWIDDFLTDEDLVLLGEDTEIKIITAWRVSVDPKCLNKLGKILNMRLQLSSKYGEYDALMRFLTETGMDFLEMIDLREIPFSNLLESVYKKANTSYFKDVLQQLRDNYSTGSTRFGRYTIRYLLLNLREDLLERVMPSQFNPGIYTYLKNAFRLSVTHLLLI